MFSTSPLSKQFIRLINSSFFQVIIKKLFRILIILKLELSLVLMKNKGGRELQNLSWIFFKVILVHRISQMSHPFSFFFYNSNAKED